MEPNRKGRAVLLYDTEQSEQQLYKNTGRLLRRAGRERMPEYLHVYCQMCIRDRYQNDGEFIVDKTGFTLVVISHNMHVSCKYN